MSVDKVVMVITNIKKKLGKKSISKKEKENMILELDSIVSMLSRPEQSGNFPLVISSSISSSKTYYEGIDNKLFEALVKKYLYKETLPKQTCNVIDPLKCNTDRLIYNLSYKEWISTEVQRCIGKTNETTNGTFIQEIFGLFPGWKSYKTGFDLRNKEMNFVVELKNKYNTIKGSNKKDLYQEFKKIRREDETITCYYAYIIPQKPGQSFNRPWCIGDDMIREICNKELSKLITGREDGIELLYDAIFFCLRDILIANGKSPIDIDTDFKKVFKQTFG